MQELNFEWFLFLSLLGITLLFWLIANRWINKRLISFLKKRDLLVIGREKNIIKLAKQILLIICNFIFYQYIYYFDLLSHHVNKSNGQQNPFPFDFHTN